VLALQKVRALRSLGEAVEMGGVEPPSEALSNYILQV